MYQEAYSQEFGNIINNNEVDKDELGFNDSVRVSPQVNNRLKNFIKMIVTQEIMMMIQAYLEKNRQKFSKLKIQKNSKFTLYEDLLIIKEFKKNQKNILKRISTTTQICGLLNINRSASSIRERMVKKLTKIQSQQLKWYIKNDENFSFDNKKDLIDKRLQQEISPQNNKRPKILNNHEQIFESNDPPQINNKSLPVSLVLKREEIEISQKMSNVSIQKEKEGKQSVESKVDKYSMETKSIYHYSPEKSKEKLISNDLKREEQSKQIAVIYNTKMKIITCVKQQKANLQAKQQIYNQNIRQVQESINESGSVTNSNKQNESHKVQTQKQSEFLIDSDKSFKTMSRISQLSKIQQQKKAYIDLKNKQYEQINSKSKPTSQKLSYEIKELPELNSQYISVLKSEVIQLDKSSQSLYENIKKE